MAGMAIAANDAASMPEEASGPMVGGTCDVGILYGSLARKLERIVRLDVKAPEPVIEDACQFAWTRLLFHAQRVRQESALSWLAKTAVHEALKLIKRDCRELSLDALIEEGADSSFPRFGTAPYEVVEWRARLRLIDLLPARQQWLLWSQGLGLSYEEMAAGMGCTPRTVERQLLRARERIRAW